ncbi:NAD(P)-dependent oxidoreductase [Thiorhodococcus minor]|uniref:SDR family oxidoreductase n=1 Tax=Thiorhodococcus minor TaxID=57489 RepID=A0A6M0JVA3_9GAMM|nr:NAD(P)-binding oxidoreductase [Thiorhodococcus minor]NEV60831.1 SDR family oxidoreductase [Thiorhodococcus minor]
MHIALFGATGGTGRQVLAQGIAQGHSISALVRDPAKLPDRAGLTKVQGDVLDPEPVAQCVAGADAVICVLGSHGRQAPVEAGGTERILEAMRASGVRRLIVVTSLGVGDSRPQLSWPVRLMMDLTLGAIMRAKEAQEALVKASGLDWTIVRPGGLTDGPKTGGYGFGVDSAIKPGRVSRADVADFVLRQLADDGFLHQAPAVV